MKNFLLILSLLAMMLPGMVPYAWAGDGNAWDYMVDISSKFGRGLTNILTGPVEIPCNIAEEMDDIGPYKGLAVGTGKGLYKMVRRMFNGVTEIATFVIPGPADMPYVCQQRDERKAAEEEAIRKASEGV
jgi:putative exosortase-associated protein (TIGR04073 family)